jgi:hypothetical protein
MGSEAATVLTSADPSTIKNATDRSFDVAVSMYAAPQGIDSVNPR